MEGPEAVAVAGMLTRPPSKDLQGDKGSAKAQSESKLHLLWNGTLRGCIGAGAALGHGVGRTRSWSLFSALLAAE